MRIEASKNILRQKVVGVKNFSNMNFDFGKSNVKNIVKLLHVSKQYSVKRR